MSEKVTGEFFEDEIVMLNGSITIILFLFLVIELKLLILWHFDISFLHGGIIGCTPHISGRLEPLIYQGILTDRLLLVLLSKRLINPLLIGALSDLLFLAP